MEIVTWVLDGEVEHRDSTGTVGHVYPGLAQRMSAGRGIRHSEMNARPDRPLHLVQMWVLPDTAGIEPSYEQQDVGESLAGGGLVAVASGRGHDDAVAIHQRDAVLWAARLAPEESVAMPDAPHVHLFVARGSGALASADDERRELETGAAGRLRDEAGARFEAGPGGAEVLVWETA
jgi:redox-sensitive bicupin YhaK (pirin superfamily)